MTRKASITRDTSETAIDLTIDLDGTGKASVNTGIGFFDHMLKAFARHGFFDLELEAKGDTYVDDHHLVEDTGIVLGEAIAKALGDKKGIRRFGSFILPMDDALVLVSLDLGGRPYFAYDFEYPTESCGGVKTEMFREFFYAVSYSAKMNLHMKEMDGHNAHHIAEASFKAFGKALDLAVSKEERGDGILSTKGVF